MPHLKQNKPYGCGLYAIANIFQDEAFITPERLKQSENGNHTGQINKWLLEYDQELYLEPFYFNNSGKRLPKWVCKMKRTGENVFSLPILIDVQYTKNSKNHFVAAEIITTGDLIVMDSLKDDVYFTTLEEFNKQNYRTFGVWYLRHYTEEGYFMRFKPGLNE